MRFIIDAHLPAKIAESFLALGHEVLHTRNLTKGNATSDSEIMDLAGTDGIVVTKDEDFYQSFLLYGRPPKLVHVKVGNMRLRAMINLFEQITPRLIDLLGQHDLLELHEDKIIVIV